MAPAWILRALLAGTLAFMAACAVPVPPAGGPVDTKPPALLSSIPADGEVNVNVDRVTLEFDEYLDERSLATALSVTPAQPRAPEIRFGGRSVELRFAEPLRDSTTFILTIDTAFRDAHNVALDTPIRIAFSTGPEIDRGRIAGTVVEWDQGKPAAGIDIYAYESRIVSADSMSADGLGEPAYRTQSDRDGRFTFDYLPNRPYYVVGIRDGNRNRRIDPGEWMATPPVDALHADTTAAEPDQPWVVAPVDRQPPELRRVDGYSVRRLLARFSEPVLPLPEGAWDATVTDTVSGATYPIRRLSVDASDPRTLVAITEDLPAGGYTFQANHLAADSSGNAVPPSALPFTPGTRADTTRSRLLSIEVDSLRGATGGETIFGSWNAPTLVFDHGPSADEIRQTVVVQAESGDTLAYRLETKTGLAWQVLTKAPFFTLSIFPGDAVVLDSMLTRRFRRAPAALLGELAGVVHPPDSSFRVVLVPTTKGLEPERTVAPDATGRFTFTDLPGERSYRMRIFRDLDGDGHWSPGSLDPPVPAEPVGWAAGPFVVRPKWETVIPDTLRIGTAPARVLPSSSVANEPDS